MLVCRWANQPPLSSQNFSKLTFQEATADRETLIAILLIKTIDSPGEQQLAAAQPWKWKDVLLQAENAASTGVAGKIIRLGRNDIAHTDISLIIHLDFYIFKRQLRWGIDIKKVDL